MPAQRTPPDGFKPFDAHQPVRRYRRHLPHHRQDGATYAATFHLADSLPAPALAALRERREVFGEIHPPPHTDEQLLKQARDLAALEERWLDQGYGACYLREQEHRTVLKEAMYYFDVLGLEEPQHALGAWVIMPNHVHVLIRPFDDAAMPLEKILQRWKSRVAQRVNASKVDPESVWFQESYDRIVRDSQHLWNCLQYIGQNGHAAGLSEHEYERWVSPEWVEQGWGFES